MKFFRPKNTKQRPTEVVTEPHKPVEGQGRIRRALDQLDPEHKIHSSRNRNEMRGYIRGQSRRRWVYAPRKAGGPRTPEVEASYADWQRRRQMLKDVSKLRKADLPEYHALLMQPTVHPAGWGRPNPAKRARRRNSMK